MNFKKDFDNIIKNWNIACWNIIPYYLSNEEINLIKDKAELYFDQKSIIVGNAFLSLPEDIILSLRELHSNNFCPIILVGVKDGQSQTIKGKITAEGIEWENN